MDKSETYIKQCNCPEIQEGHERHDGDVYWHRGFSKVYTYGTERSYYADNEKGKYIWLPTQSDLQGMVEEMGFGWFSALVQFTIFANQVMVEDCYVTVLQTKHTKLRAHVLEPKFTSMEQLWLAFVMLTLYHKRWDPAKEEWR